MAKTFGLDPVMVADEPDLFLYAFRVAAHNRIARDSRQQQTDDEMNRQADEQ